MAEAQKPDNIVQYIDTEFALNPEYAKVIMKLQILTRVFCLENWNESR